MSEVTLIEKLECNMQGWAKLKFRESNMRLIEMCEVSNVNCKITLIPKNNPKK